VWPSLVYMIVTLLGDNGTPHRQIGNERRRATGTTPIRPEWDMASKVIGPRISA
jgi:hypothetical protein